MINPIFGGVSISRFGNEKMRAELLPKIISGELNCCMALTEPDAGTNTLELKTFAAADGDGWRLNGRKIWITGVEAASKMLVVARTKKITEAQSPLLFRRRELAEGSGGEGRRRGGMGARIEIENTEQAPFSIACATFDRRHNPARGRAGGANGAVGKVQLASGKVLPGKETYVVPAGDRLVAEMPGGGGYGRKS